MRLYAHHMLMAVVVVVVVVYVTAKTVNPNPDQHPQLKHFNIYGCQTNASLSRKLDLHADYLETKPGFFFGVSGSNKTVTVSKSPTCRLQPNTLYCAQRTKYTHLTLVEFREIALEGKLKRRRECDLNETTDDGDKEKDQNYTICETEREEEDTIMEINDFEMDCGFAETTEGGEPKQNEEDGEELPKKIVKRHPSITCHFGDKDVMSLKSGYGFVACQGDPNPIVGQWKEWLVAVADIEAEAASLKNRILIGVICGTLGLLILLVLCVVCRLRSARSTAFDERRRPSYTSGKTHSTQDQPSRS